MDVDSMTPEELDGMVRHLWQQEDDVRMAARRGEPFPEWAEQCEPTERALLRLYWHHERAYCVPRNRGVAPF